LFSKAIPKRVLYVAACLTVLLSLFNGCQPLQIEEVPFSIGEGNVLNLYGIDPHTLDPAVSGDATSHEYVLQLFSGLVSLDDSLKPVPDIAEDWQLSNGGKTYTFFLRRDVRFHNSREVKAEDIKLSWERAANPDTNSRTAPNYLGDIVGIEDVFERKSREISGVRVIDDYTLEVTIDGPKTYFLSKLTYPTAYVVDMENTKSGSDWWRKPNGTGPFKLGEWDEGDRLVLEKNDHYHGELAEVDYVIFNLWGGVPMNLYETDQIDVTGVSVPYIDKITDDSGAFYKELIIAPELSFYFIGFNTTKPPFNDINIRRAFSLAIDKDKLVSLIFRDLMQPAEGILPPGLPGYKADLPRSKYDPDMAKELIEESSYSGIANLPPITISTTGWGGLISKEVEAIVHQWRENLGVEVKVRQLEPEWFLYNLKEEKDEIFDIGWIADYPHPQDFLEVLFRTGAENNYGEYSNPEVDELLRKAGIELDYELSLELYRQAEQKLVEDVACLPLWFGRNFVLVKPYIKGYNLNPLGLVKLNDISLEK